MKHILSLFLMLQIILSSTSLKVSMHYCLGSLSDIAVFSDADVCNFEKYFGTPVKEGVQLKNKSCCGTEQVLINGQNHQTSLEQKKQFVPFNGLLVQTPIKTNETASIKFTKKIHKNPSLTEPPLFLQAQSFLL